MIGSLRGTRRGLQVGLLRGVRSVQIKRTCRGAGDTERCGGEVAEQCGVGDVVLLRGTLGAGKTTFARGFVRKLLRDEGLFVTSPSYLLDNTYQTPENITVHHMDLYRLPNNFDSSILGIPDIFESCICLIEWPDRMLSSNLKARRQVIVKFSILSDEVREIEVSTALPDKEDHVE